jgi:hypothetical protein
MPRPPNLLTAVALAAVAALAACAGAAPRQKQSWDTERRSAATAPGGAAPAGPAADAGTSIPSTPATALTREELAGLNAAAFVKRYPRPEFCEEAARSLQRQSRDKAWDVLKACIQRGKFTLLTRLVSGAWSEDLRTRPEASNILASVVAMRGGDAIGDLQQMRAQRVPLFPIGPAMGHPDMYKGRLVLFRAEVRDVKLAGGKSTARLAEFTFTSEQTWVDDGRRVSRSWSNSSSWGSGSGTTSWQSERRLGSNKAHETGLEAVARLSAVDPFFEPGRQFVVLARFEGVREQDRDLDGNEGDPDNPSKIAMVSVISYFEPAAAVVE